jgi:hypothetical protein
MQQATPLIYPYSVKQTNGSGAWSSGLVLSGTLSTGKKIHNS